MGPREFAEEEALDKIETAQIEMTCSFCPSSNCHGRQSVKRVLSPSFSIPPSDSFVTVAVSSRRRFVNNSAALYSNSANATLLYGGA